MAGERLAKKNTGAYDETVYYTLERGGVHPAVLASILELLGFQCEALAAICRHKGIAVPTVPLAISQGWIADIGLSKDRNEGPVDQPETGSTGFLDADKLRSMFN